MRWLRRAPSVPACVLGALLITGAARADTLPEPFRVPEVQVHAGFERRDDALLLTGTRPRLIVKPPDPTSFRVDFEVELAPGKGATELWFAPRADVYGKSPGSFRISVRRDENPRKATISFQPTAKLPNGKWTGDRSESRSLDFSRRSWARRYWNVTVERSAGATRLLFDGQTMVVAQLEANEASSVVIDFQPKDRIRRPRVRPSAPSLFVTVPLGAAAESVAGPAMAEEQTVDDVPFQLANHGRDVIDVRRAHWRDWKADPGHTAEGYDIAAVQYGDPTWPMLSVPTGDYVAAHALVSNPRRANTAAAMSLTFGAFGKARVRQYVTHATVAVTKGAALQRVRLPMGVPLTRELPGILQLVLGKEVRLAVRQTDPSRFRYRPLGLPSGVRVHALTLEKSPLAMEVRSDEAGNAFVEPAMPAFRVTLRNQTGRAHKFQLHTIATHLDGHRMFHEQSGEVAPHATSELRLVMPVLRRGYYDYRLELADEQGNPLLTQESSFALLPPDGRKHRSVSPFGAWDFSGAHDTSRDANVTGALYRKLGFRYGMFRFTAEERARFGVIQGREPVSLENTQGYDSFLAKNPDAPPVALLMHEHGLSTKHLQRAPDLFDGRAAYVLDAQERKTLDDLFGKSRDAALAFRKRAPHVHLRLGNGALPTKEEFYRKGYPAELFDSAGNEAAAFGRPPEAQPPDYVASNASLWMDRKLLDHYGYGAKPVTQCFETCFPSTNPGNLTYATQADYFVRHALHALAWKIPEIRLGMIGDAGNSYYFSNWGASGLCTAMPDVRVKPAFTALATLTSVLDGARFAEVIELGSPSLYALAFDAPAGRKIYALWTLRGRRDVELELSAPSAASWTTTDGQGNGTTFAGAGSKTLTLGPSPIYLAGTGTIQRARPRPADHSDGEPASRVTPISPLDGLEDWTIETERDYDLEFHDSLTPRKPGRFTFAAVAEFEGRRGAVEVTPSAAASPPTTTTRYTALRHRTGLTLPGQPSAIGLWVNGNSSFGRVIFDLEDARGERWLSIGRNSELGLRPELERLVPPAFARSARIADWNTDDVFGLSRFDFDGWRYVSFPLPGNYPGEGYGWPANSQWMSDREGRVDYPLRLRRLVVELPEGTLHVARFAPAPRPAVYIWQLVVEHAASDWLAPPPDRASSRRGPFR